MSTAARKARKRAGIQFQHPVKVGTPIEQRAVPAVYKRDSVFGLGNYPSNRAQTKLANQRQATHKKWDAER